MPALSQCPRVTDLAVPGMACSPLPGDWPQDRRRRVMLCRAGPAAVNLSGGTRQGGVRLSPGPWVTEPGSAL